MYKYQTEPKKSVSLNRNEHFGLALGIEINNCSNLNVGIITQPHTLS